MSSEPVVEARGLGKAYPIYRKPEDRLKQLLWGRRRRYYEEFWAVQGVDMTVGRGETMGIIGRNGSGKSTLLQMICGTLRPSAGEVRVRGRIAAMLELGSGFNPQFSGRENVRLGAAVLGLSAAEIDARFDAIAGFADIGAFLDQPMRNYSSGMHARLAFAVCANVDADVLVVDEILSVGDAAFQQKCMRYLNRFRLQGTLLFVSHDSAAVVKLCDRALWLDMGQVQGLGEAKEMCRLYLASQAEEMGDGAAGFRVRGRNANTSSPRSAVLPQAIARQDGTEDSDADALVFDPDDLTEAKGGVDIESVAFHGAEGGRLRVAAGGELVELRIVCRAGRMLRQPVAAFVVRDRLGQILFSDDSGSAAGEAGAGISAGQPFTAKFCFFLPYLASGAYAVEAYLFERGTSGFELLQRRVDKQFLHVQSIHPSNGLANIAMRAVSLDVTAPKRRSDAAAAVAEASGR